MWKNRHVVAARAGAINQQTKGAVATISPDEAPTTASATLRAVARHSLPAVVESTLVPTAFFYVAKASRARPIPSGVLTR